MMTERTELLLGQEGVAKLKEKSVMVFGVGGVGSYCVEALARVGVGKLTLVDGDVYADSNRNRQLGALVSTIGKPKTEVTAARIHDINPDCVVTPLNQFYLGEGIDFAGYDYVVDCVDTVTAKLHVIVNAKANHIPVISCMGTGNKLHAELFRIADISKTSVCPLAKVMRRECKERGITKVKVLFSTELPVQRGSVVGSVSFVPSVAGLLLAGEVVRDLI